MSDYDVVVVGGGIAGLWALSSLRQAGYNTVLLEKNTLGGQQTLASQGIIHGGTKYALTGKLTGSSEAVRGMPARWKEHLAGRRIPDLSPVKVNTQHQWMWDAGGVTARISNFFASKVMSSRVQHVTDKRLPEILQGQQVYQLDEPVLDVRSVLQAIAEKSQGAIFQAEVMSAENHPDGVSIKVKTTDGITVINAGSIIFSAGEGNETIQQAPMQRRPLQMVLVKGNLPALCGHIIEANANPRLTITSHEANEHETVWYLGGRLAENGANMNGDELIEKSKRELASLLPEVNWQNKQWATLPVDRAEGAQSGGKRPDEPVIRQRGRQLTAWPTKLVFAPLVADLLLEKINEMGILKNESDGLVKPWPAASIGQYPWEQVHWRE